MIPQSVIAAALLLVASNLLVRGSVVINEIFYHAPNDVEDLQFIELYNTSSNSVDLTNWRLGKEVTYSFPREQKLPGHAYLVLASHADRFKEHYGFAPDGTFQGLLSHKGSRIELFNARGKKVDTVKFKDEAPWPLGADGYSASLERICPTVDGDLPENWASSPLPKDEMKAAGTPGKANANFSATLPPVISRVTFDPATPAPNQPVRVEAQVRASGALRDLTLRYWLAAADADAREQSLPMTKLSDNRFTASIPGQADRQLVRFRIEAVDQAGANRAFPAEHEPRPALSYFVSGKLEPAKVPFALIFNTDKQLANSMANHLQAPNQRGRVFTEEDQMRMMARMQIENGVRLPALWYALVAPEGLSAAKVTQLQPAFASATDKLGKLSAEIGKASDIKTAARELPARIKAFHVDLAKAVEGLLDETGRRTFAEAQEKQLQKTEGGRMNWTPEMVLDRFANLDGVFYRVTTVSQITDQQLADFRRIFKSALAERAELADAAKALIQGQGDFQDFREKVDKVTDSANRQVKTVLSSAQANELARRQPEPEGFMGGRGQAKPPHGPVGRSAFVYVDPVKGTPELFDFVTVSDRNAGLNVHFHKDHLFRQMSTLNVLFEAVDRFVLAEPLAYELYRRVGNAAPLAEHARLWVDNKLLGYYELIEQPNRAFLQRNGLQGEGNLYKILWFGNGVVGQHEKKTHRETGHNDIVDLVDQLEKTKADPDEQWAVIQKNFQVGQVVNYFAVNMCLSHWDGFFNNYFAYHDVGGTGRWEMYPWDQDKTWGFHDGIQGEEVFFDMPITFGMEGDRPPGWPKDRPVPRGFGMGGPWWRPGGWFSKPLLANPHFRKLFLARTKEILNTIYTEQVFFPLIEAMGERLKEEVRVRATVLQQDPNEAEQQLQKNLHSLKEHLRKRREFLLSQDEIRALGPTTRASLP